MVAFPDTINKYKMQSPECWWNFTGLRCLAIIDDQPGAFGLNASMYHDHGDNPIWIGNRKSIRQHKF